MGDAIHLRRTRDQVTSTGFPLHHRLLFKVQLEPFSWTGSVVFEQVFEIRAWCSAASYSRPTRNIERQLTRAVKVAMAIYTTACVPWLTKGCDTVAIVH
jgi:hypothetical protein